MAARTLVVLNPHSRGGSAGRRFAHVESRLRDALGPLDVERTRGPRDAERIAREGVRAGAELVVVAGGDGTTSEVVSGLLGAGLGDAARVGLLPFGTGGDLTRCLGLSRDVDRAISAIAAGATRRVDAGRAHYRQRDGSQGTVHFLNISSFGVSGLVTELVNRAPKLLGGRISFLIGTIRAIAGYRALHVELEADGEIVHAGPLVLATAANGRFFGGGMHVAPRAELDDGLFDLVVVPGFSNLRLLRELPRIYRGTHLEVPGVVHRRARRLEAKAEPGTVWIEFDGEPLGTLPASFELLPGAITLVGAGS